MSAYVGFNWMKWVTIDDIYHICNSIISDETLTLKWSIDDGEKSIIFIITVLNYDHKVILTDAFRLKKATKDLLERQMEWMQNTNERLVHEKS